MAVPDIPIVDAHQHFWDLTRNYHPWLCDEPPPRLRYGDYTPLRRNYLPADYRRDAAGFTVAGTVHVEAEWDPEDPIGETRWVHALAAREGLPTVMVGRARLDREDVAEVLAEQASFPLMRGIRHKPKTAPGRSEVRRGTEGSMDDPAWRRGYALLETFGLSFDLQVPWWHLDEAGDLAADFPSIRLIIDHAGQVDGRGEEELAHWRRAMERLARQPNVAVKISGLGLAGRRWRLADNRPVIDDVIAIFGADRCMFASNFPVDRLVGDFATIYRGFFRAVERLPVDQQRMLFRDNARRFYRIDPVPRSPADAGTVARPRPPRYST